MSDRIAVMNGGIVEHLGTPEEVYLRPASLFVAGFIGQTSFMPVPGGVRREPTASRSRSKADIARGARAPTRRVTVGTDAVVVVRPEHVRLSPTEPPAGEAAVPVTVLDEVFQGSVVRYQLQGPGDLRLAALVPLDERADVHTGVDAWATWSPEWGYVLPPAADDLEGVASTDPSL